MKIFLDTNVLIDYLIEERPCHPAAFDFVQSAYRAGERLMFATSQATDVYYILKRIATEEAVRAGLVKLFQICELYPTSETACAAALDSPLSDYEDAVQVEVAREARCDYIVTRDLRDYGSSPVPFIDPAGFLALQRTQKTPSGQGGA